MQIATLPSYPDDSENVVLLSLQGNIIDQVAYSKGWRFALLRDDEGVALERINANALSNDKTNRHSAASTAGCGTPGYVNNQYKQALINPSSISVIPKIFSPDNDGHDDVATIQYHIKENGYIANVFIFDAAGRQVRHLVKNALLGRMVTLFGMGWMNRHKNYPLVYPSFIPNCLTCRERNNN